MTDTTAEPIAAPRLYTYKEAAALLGVSVDFLRKKVRAREIQHRRDGADGRIVRFSDDDIRAYVDLKLVRAEPLRRPVKPVGRGSGRRAG